MKTRVIGNWNPWIDFSNISDSNRKFVADSFKIFLHYLGYEVTIQSATPNKIWNGKELGWHCDCFLANDSNFIIWSNAEPTLVRLTNTKELILTREKDVILINNLEAEHRTPEIVNADRWIVRTNHLNV